MRILLKLTGDLFGDNERAVSLLKSKEVAEKIIKIKKAGIQLAIVVGGGNIFREEKLA